MDTSFFNDDVADLPISCTLCLIQEGVSDLDGYGPGLRRGASFKARSMPAPGW